MEAIDRRLKFSWSAISMDHQYEAGTIYADSFSDAVMKINATCKLPDIYSILINIEK